MRPRPTTRATSVAKLAALRDRGVRNRACKMHTRFVVGGVSSTKPALERRGAVGELQQDATWGMVVVEERYAAIEAAGAIRARMRCSKPGSADLGLIQARPLASGLRAASSALRAPLIFSLTNAAVLSV
jgi:hypothetical protein